MTRPITTLALCLFITASSLAQASAEPPADFLRSINKMYVVVAVIVVVFLGLAYYLWSLDRKVTDLENQFKDHA